MASLKSAMALSNSLCSPQEIPAITVKRGILGIEANGLGVVFHGVAKLFLVVPDRGPHQNRKRVFAGDRASDS